MLNRLYIVIGVLAILVLAAAFIVPRLIPWGDYRGRMQLLAGQALGTEVRINGDIRFSLLPSPHLVLHDVSVGPAAQPVISVKSADADFSLIDFLRDRYSMTKLVLDHPILDLRIAKDGTLATGLKLAGADSKVDLSVASAAIEVGTLRVSDAGSGRKYAVEGVNGELTIGTLNGPFGFRGGGSLGEQHYDFHFTSGPLDAAGNTQVSLFVQPDGNAGALTLAGQFKTGGMPQFTGDLSYRQSPPQGKNGNGVIGDLTLAGKLDATPRQASLSTFTLIPDENRAVNRMAGSATLDLGAKPSFAATLSSGVLSLPPRDATAEARPQPYELVRMLGELPVVPLPPIAGTISASLDELDLRSFSLRNVKLEATAGDKGWTIAGLSGVLPGNTALKLSGDLTAPDGRPSFAGTLGIASERLDALADLWRKPAADNPLFGLPGSFASKVSLLGPTMAITDGKLTLDGISHSLTALVRFGDKPRVDLSGQFTDLSDEDSAALLALVPDVADDASAAVTFPEGAVSLAADSATLFGLKGQKLELEGKWGDGAVELSKFAAADLGGAKFDLSLALSGTIAAPRIAGDGDVSLAAAGGPALDRLFDALGTPPPVRALLARSLPADLKAHLDDPNETGGQGLSLSGKAGVADVTVVAQLDGGIAAALKAPIEATLDLESAEPRQLTSQLGLGDVSIVPETGPMRLAASLRGPPGGPMTTSVSLEGGGDSIAFNGSVAPGDLSAPSGQGALKLALSDSSVLADDLGLAGLYTPPVKGTADVQFSPDGAIRLDNIEAASGTDKFTGKLALARDRRGAVVSGALTIDSLDVASLVAAGGGPTALMASAGKLWPDGPIALGEAPRQTSGSVTIETPRIALGQQPFLTDAGFDFSWDATNVGVHRFAAKLGGGGIALEANLCCAGPLADKQLGGQASITGVSLAALLPPATAATLSGRADGSVRFSGTGDSVDALISGVSGDGSFSLADFSIGKFDPAAFAAVASIGDIVDVAPKDLGAKVATALDQGAFTTPHVEGSFTLAGGTLRIANLAAATPAAKLFGSASVKLSDLALGGAFALTPVGTLDAAGLVSETTSKVTANLSGTLGAPVRSLDIAGMVDAIKVRALENEVARLEKLKAQDDARSKAAAAANKEATEDQERQQLAAQQAADAALKQAQADAAAKEAADAAAKAAADAAAAQQATDAAAAKRAADAAKEAADAAAAKQAADAAAAKRAAAKKAAQQPPPPLDLQMPQPPFFQPLN